MRPVNIIPFYQAIDRVIEMGLQTVVEKQRIKTMRTEAEIRIQMQVEVKRRLSEIEEREKKSQHERDIDKLFKAQEASDLINQREHERQLSFEKHRVDLFERIKRLEIEIHQQILTFDIDRQKELREWQRDFIRRLEDESEQVLSERVPRLLYAAEPFKDQEIIYQQYTSRIFQVADRIAESIAADQEHFRDALRELALRPGKLTDSLIEMNKQLMFSSATTKMLEDKIS